MEIVDSVLGAISDTVSGKDSAEEPEFAVQETSVIPVAKTAKKARKSFMGGRKENTFPKTTSERLCGNEKSMKNRRKTFFLSLRRALFRLPYFVMPRRDEFALGVSKAYGVAVIVPDRVPSWEIPACGALVVAARSGYETDFGAGIYDALGENVPMAHVVHDAPSGNVRRAVGDVLERDGLLVQVVVIVPGRIDIQRRNREPAGIRGIFRVEIKRRSGENDRGEENRP